MIILQIVLILLAISICLLAWIIFLPVILKLNTGHNLYTIFQPGTFALRLINRDNSLNFRLDIFGFAVPPTKGKHSNKKSRRKPSTNKRASIRSMMKFLKATLSAMRVKRFRVDLDTGNPADNAKLFPFLLLLNSRTFRIALNNNGYLSADIDIRIRLYLLIIPIFNFIFKNRYYGS